MDRQQAISKARNLRKVKIVMRFVPEEISKEIEEHWERTEHQSISAAKRHMRSLGIGVALTDEESLPE